MCSDYSYALPVRRKHASSRSHLLTVELPWVQVIHRDGQPAPERQDDLQDERQRAWQLVQPHATRFGSPGGEVHDEIMGSDQNLDNEIRIL